MGETRPQVSWGLHNTNKVLVSARRLRSVIQLFEYKRHEALFTNKKEKIMGSVLQKEFLVADWHNGAKIINGSNINEAAYEFLGKVPVFPTQNHHMSAAFGCELTEDVKHVVLSKEPGVDQSEALAGFPGVKHFVQNP